VPISKDFFVPKKQKHEMRLTNGLAKDRRTVLISTLVPLFCPGLGRRTEIWPVKEASAFKYKFNFGFRRKDFKFRPFAKPRHVEVYRFSRTADSLSF